MVVSLIYMIRISQIFRKFMVNLESQEDIRKLNQQSIQVIQFSISVSQPVTKSSIKFYHFLPIIQFRQSISIKLIRFYVNELAKLSLLSTLVIYESMYIV